MPEARNKTYGKNPFAVPEPYYLPGYTGHCPKYHNVIGQTYGRATHTVMEKLPTLPGRLKPLPEDGNWQKQPTELEDEDILEERNMGGRALLTRDIAPGYKGHVPRANQMIGVNFNQGCIMGIVEFEKKRRRLQELLHGKTC